MAYLPCSPKLVPLSAANSPQTLGMLPQLQLSPIWEQGALAVQQGERHCQQNPNQSSNQSMPVANESGASTQPWQTPASILNHEL